MKVSIFVPCFIDQLYPDVAFNMVKLLKKAGCEVVYNEEQTCCGQPAFNAGFWGEAKDVCNKFVNDFKDAEYIVAPSASCIGFVKNYYKQLFDDRSLLQKDVLDLQHKVFELSEFLVDHLKITDFGAILQARATYHDSCAALREVGIKNAPRILLSKVKGLELVEMNDVETCCGFGGTFAVKFDPISIAMADQKIDNANAVQAEYVISTDMSCLMHIEGRMKNRKEGMKAMHLADVLTSGW